MLRLSDQLWPRKLTVPGNVASGLPLFIKDVATLSWDKCDGLVDEVADAANQLRWYKLTRPMRSLAAIQELANISQEQDVTNVALEQPDIDNLCERGMLKEIEPHTGRKTCHSFTVEESAKGRRRWICHPRWFNDVSDTTDHGVEFPTVEGVIRRCADFRYAVCLDFAGYFQQFPIEETVGQFFSIRKDGRCWSPTTVPTGSNTPPLFGQLLASTMAASATKAFPSVAYDTFIDNIRFCADNDALLMDVVKTFYGIAAKMGVTINEKFEEIRPLQQYTFLGILFDHEKGSVNIGDKTRNKIKAQIVLIGQAGFDPEHCFGVSVWASIVTGFQLHKAYHVFKYIRRTLNAKKRDSVEKKIWPSIVPQWTSWLQSLVDSDGRVVRTETCEQRSTFHIFTDASRTGYGAVIMGGGAVSIIAGSWQGRQLHKHINILEAVAIRFALQKWNCQAEGNVQLHLHVDNTSVIATCRKGRSRSFLLNYEVGNIRKVCEDKGYKIVSWTYVASANNIADPMSRLPVYLGKPIEVNATTHNRQQTTSVGIWERGKV